MNIAQYVLKHSIRGECKCGKCIDVGNKPDPLGHTADIVFFKVVIRDNPKADTFRRLTSEHKGVFISCNPLDGHEHGYIQLGSWIGDQGIALQYMALGSLLGVFDLLTPRKIPNIDQREVMRLAGIGLITIKSKS